MRFGKSCLFLAVIVAFCLPSTAQQIERLQVDVPFNFVAAGKSLPAGRYTVKSVRMANAPNDVWEIEGDYGSAMVLTSRVESLHRSHNLSVVFLQAGDQYSLLQIWNSQHSGQEAPVSKAGRQNVIAENTKYVEIKAE